MLEESDYYAPKVNWKNVATKIDADTIATNFSEAYLDCNLLVASTGCCCRSNTSIWSLSKPVMEY